MPMIAGIRHLHATEGPLREEIPAAWVPNEEDRAALNTAARHAETEVVTVTEEAKQTIEKAQAEADAKITDAKKMAQQLINEATLDWEKRKATFEKNTVLKTNNITEKNSFVKSKQEFAHPILKLMRNT